MKRFYKLFVSWFLCLFLVLSQFIVSLADVKSLMIGSGSNALMTMELDDEDYGISTFSSLASVVNTVMWDSDVSIEILLRNSSGSTLTDVLTPANFTANASGLRIKYSAPSGYVIYGYNVYLKSLHFDFLPPVGNYDMSVDISSQFSHDYLSPGLWCQKLIDNATGLTSYDYLNSTSSSGDLYIPPFVIEINNISRALLQFMFDGTYSDIDSVLHVNFTKTSGDASIVTPGSGSAAQDYQSDVSSSLSDLSSSVDTMTDEISGVTEAIQNLQGAMEPHYSNVLTQLHHITEQLHAFYDQVYNNIHLPELDMLTQIKTAIENIDLQIEVDISEVKTAINNMSTAIQNKLQTTTDQITNGYDNSGIVQENEKLEQSINDYDEVESEIFDEAGGFVGEFEYPSIDSLSGSVIKALAFVGSFLQSIFLSMGDFSSIITFSLTMIFVMVVVGYHRIRS